MKRKTRRLGKGLDALLGDVDEPEAAGQGVKEIDVGEIKPNRFQPRRTFSDDKLDELAESIKVHGVVQPVLLRRAESGFELVAGERRWRAAKIANMPMIPAIVREFEEHEMMEIALVENLQREDLNPIEQAAAYRALQESVGLTQAEVADRIGVSRSQVANMIRLLNLPEEVQAMVEGGTLSAGHAKVVLGMESEEQVEFAELVADQGLTVRQAEAAAQQWQESQETGATVEAVQEEEHAGSPDDDIFLQDVQSRLARGLGTPVSLRDRGGQGRIVIEYFDYEDLDRLLDMILGA